MDRVIINGTEVLADGLDSFAPQYGVDDESKTYTYSKGSQLTVYGDDAKELVSVFFSDCSGMTRSLPIRIYKECCDKWFDFTIQYEGTTYCIEDGTCSVQFTPTRISTASKFYQYLSSTIYWKEGFVDAFQHPQVWYCNQPGFLQKVLFILAPLVVAILAVIEAIINVIDSICDAIASIFGGDCNIETPYSACDFLNSINGCGRKVPSPLIREILEYHCTLKGFTLVSSVFQNTIYKNMVLFQLQYERGRYSPINWISENGANVTVSQLLDDLAETMNMEYRVIGNTLVFEREDYFKPLHSNAGQVDDLDYCMTYKIDNACAYGRFAYSDDTLDQEGNKLVEFTDDIIEYNPENADWKRGECSTVSQFGRARFMFDQAGGSSVDDPFFPDLAIDGIRSGHPIANIFNEIAGQLAGYVSSNCNDEQRRTRDLIIHNDQANRLKLLILEEGFNRDDARTIRKALPNGAYSLPLTLYWYNYPMSYREFDFAAVKV